MLNKKGQFYLLAAIVIIGIIVGFVGVSNYAKKQSSVRVYDLGTELDIEGGWVLEYGTIQTDKEDDMNKLLNDFTLKYNQYLGGVTDVYFIFGNKDKVWFVTYEKVVIGEIRIDEAEIIIKEGNPSIEEKSIEEGQDTIGIDIGDNHYEFEIKPGENFYFIISQEIGDEIHISTNQ